ncbi:MAG: calcium/sodium antiporter [Sphaerochaeta sp.]|jgi:cation:H+ antiporter|nr:MAG: calcium/sodium antiporter [Sphaerochaeta sp.]HNZ94506.1 calcium/sodium antiporter [Sphaerochaeta sp.]HPB42406.1 calcium/sodium antiporter [Sphaerochaeta sp.]HPY45955.1 calcium/sodium antiporter [Sphaerochaeta sp.]HQB05866.1 calcium/sodium antiporter [Sphaerochaeta sp.]
MLVPVVLFIVGLVLLIKGGDWFVDGAVGIAHRYHIPEILIGATVVSIGTTIPEVLVSSIAAGLGQSQTAYGNAIGSVICNTALIAAITIAVKPADTVDTGTFRIPVFFFFGAAALYSAVAYTTGQFTRVVGSILLSVFVVYMMINTKKAFSGELVLDVEEDDEKEAKESSLGKDLLLLILGAAVIAVGADLLVKNGKIIAEGLGVPESVIALTFVALGTSLPELVTAITSLAKGHGSLSLGNIVGANLFNLVLVSGLAVTIRPFGIPTEKMIAGHNASLLVDLPVMFAVMVLMTLPALLKKRLYRWQGIMLLCIYAAYVSFQFFF